jgi:hypothetical protein
LNSLKFVVVLEGCNSKLLENTTFDEALKVTMQRTAGAKFWWHRFPLAPGPQDIKDAVENLAVRQGRSPSFPIPPTLGQQTFYLLPKFLR